jgi:hypothetical protein
VWFLSGFDGFWAAKVLMGFVTRVEYFSSFQRGEQHAPYIHTDRYTDIHTYLF